MAQPDVLEIDPQTVVDAEERATVIFAQFMVDEITTNEEALRYGADLLQRLKDEGLALVKAPGTVS